MTRQSLLVASGIPTGSAMWKPCAVGPLKNTTCGSDLVRVLGVTSMLPSMASATPISNALCKRSGVIPLAALRGTCLDNPWLVKAQ